MSAKTDNTMSVAETLACLLLLIEGVTLRRQIESERAEAEAAQDSECEREARRKLGEVNKLINVEDVKQYARCRMEGQLGDNVASEIDRIADYVIPQMKTTNILGLPAPLESKVIMWELWQHLTVCEMAGEGLLRWDNPAYEQSRELVQRSVLPNGRSLEQKVTA